MNLEYVEYFTSKYKKEVKNLYLNSFPKSERFPFWLIKQCSKGENTLFNVILDNNKLIGMEYIISYGNTAYCMYLAIDKNQRGNGYGSKILENLRKKYETVILRIERPKDDLNDNKKRRKNFYLKNGFVETNKFTQDNGVEYEILCTNKDYKITKEALEKIYTKMSDSNIIRYLIGKMFNVYNVCFIK